MPIGDNPTATYTNLILFKTQGAAQVQEQIRGVGQQVRSAGQQMYRYTYYAMMALRLGQTLVSGALLRNVVRPAEETSNALARIAALSEEAAQSMGLIQTAAERVALHVPYTVAEILKAIENLYRAGRSLPEAMADVEAVAQLAIISGRSLAEEANLVASALTAFYEDVQRGALDAGKVAGQMAFAMTQSMYTIADLAAALGNAMATAAGFNQSFAQTLTLITAFGRAGVPAAMAGTMVNQMLARFGDPQTLEFLEAAMAYYEELRGTAPPIFTETGYGDLGRVMVATAEALQAAAERAKEEGWGAEFWRQATLVMGQVFGVRNIRAFMALANTGLETYDKLQAAIAESEDYVAEYTGRLQTSWEYTKQWAGTISHAIRTMLGAPMLGIMNPVLRMVTELGVAIRDLGAEYPTLRTLTSLFLLLGSVTAMVSGAVAIGAGMWGIYRGRLQDVGNELIRTQAWAAAMSARGIGPIRIALEHFLGIAKGPLKIFAGLVTLIAGGFLAWQKNLAGFRTMMEPTFQKLANYMKEPAKLGRQIAESIKNWFRGPEIAAFGRGAFGGKETTGGFYWALNIGVRALTEGAKIAGRVLHFIGTTLNWAFGGFFKTLAYIFGFGNIERGFKELGEAVGFILGTGALSLLAFSIYRVGRAALWGAGKLIFYGLRFSSWILDLLTGVRLLGNWQQRLIVGLGGVYGAAIGTPLAGRIGMLIDSLIRTTTPRLLQLLGGELLRIGMGRGILGGMARFLGGNVLLRGITLLATRILNLDQLIRTLLIPTLQKIVAWLWAHALKPIAGGVFGTLGTILLGVGGMKSIGEWYGKGGIIGAVIRIIWLVLTKAIPAILMALVGLLANPWTWVALIGTAALAGIGYGIYKLVTGPKAYAAEVPQTTIATPAAYAVAGAPSYSVSFAPTIVLPAGTTQQQAEQIIGIVRAEFPRLLESVTSAKRAEQEEIKFRAQDFSE